jgi:D-sedoheptulose 7-phosphate isomerase
MSLHEGEKVSATPYTASYLREAVDIIERLDRAVIDDVVRAIARVRGGGGRLFFLGVGGSAANCSHAVNDFRKIAQVEAYTPTDNVAELTARINDDGWQGVFADWLKGSRINSKDAVFVFSVGGGNLERNVSPNLVQALKLAKEVGATVLGVVGRDGGFTAQVADACVVIPVVNPATITPHTEAFHAVVWHLIVTHPELKAKEMKWESIG